MRDALNVFGANAAAADFPNVMDFGPLGNFPAATTGAQHDTTIVVIVKATTTAAVIVTVNESKDNSTWAAIGTIAIPSGTAAGEKRLFKIPPRHARFLKLTSSAAQSLEAWFEPGPKNDE